MKPKLESVENKDLFRCTKTVFIEAKNESEARLILQKQVNNPTNKLKIRDAETWDIEHAEIQDYEETIP